MVLFSCCQVPWLFGARIGDETENDARPDDLRVTSRASPGPLVSVMRLARMAR